MTQPIVTLIIIVSVAGIIYGVVWVAIDLFLKRWEKRDAETVIDRKVDDFLKTRQRIQEALEKERRLKQQSAP